MENPNRNFKSQTCEDFIEVLASKAAVPGGGGASALAGAIGIALGNMVGSLTVGKKTYADVEEEIIECKKQADEIAKEFLELMDKDAEAFEPLSKAYSVLSLFTHSLVPSTSTGKVICTLVPSPRPSLSMVRRSFCL